jgi:hypothetical protein
MGRRANRPTQASVWYRGLPYTLDLLECRRALVQRQVEGGLDSMEGLGDACGISRSTASRFFSGRPTSLAITLKIVSALGLTFEQVAKPAEVEGQEEDGEGPSGVAGRRVPPCPTRPGSSMRLAGGYAG